MRRPSISKPDTATDNSHLGGPSALEGPSASDAKQAIRKQKASPVAHYTRDLAEVLSSLAECFDSDDENKAAWRVRLLPRVKSRHATKTENAGVEEWDGTFAQIKDALETGNVEAIGCYLRDAAEVLRILAALLDPPQGSKEWRLEFTRKVRGRRPDNSMSRMFAETALDRELRTKTRELGKQEAAIADIKEKTGQSRATIFRNKTRSKHRPQSHKKR